MKYISVFSGIEAASVAWKDLGWEPVAFSEIEPFPCAVLSHYYPEAPNVGDISKADWSRYAGMVDLVVGGSPCQSFSVAGKREGLAGASGLVKEYFRLLKEVRPRWFIWENVPGVFSSGGGREFPFILSCWNELGYHVAWRVLDAQYFGVPQRRRRVFAVGHIADWRYPAAVLFEPESLRGHTSPRRKARKENTGGAAEGTGKASRRTISGKDKFPTLQANCGSKLWLGNQEAFSGDYFIKEETETLVLNDQGGGAMDVSKDVTGTLRAQTHGHEPIVFEPGVMSRDGGHVYDGVAPTLRAEPGDNRPCVIPINTQVATRHKNLGERTGLGIGEEGDPAYTLQAGHEHAVFCIAGNTIDRQLQNGGNGAGFQEDISYTLNTIDRHAVATLNSLTPWDRTQDRITDANGVHPTLNAWEGGGYHGINVFDRHAVAECYSFDSLASNSMKSSNPHSGCRKVEVSKTLDTSDGNPTKNQGGIAVVCAPVAPTIGASGPPYSRPGNDRVETEALCWNNMQVRRLTPLECERLQGFPDNFTDIPFKGKPASDSARYKALGNSMAVPVMRWIGERIQQIEDKPQGVFR